MAARALKHVEAESEPNRLIPPLEPASDKHAVQHSPARALQAHLQQAIASDYAEPFVQKAHPLARLGVLFSLTSFSWALVLLLARFLLR